MEFPYLPDGREILFVSADNEFMQAAEKAAEELSLDSKHRTGAVIVKNGKIIGRGANGSEYHEQNGCRRKELGCKTGEGYDLCEGCSPKNHAEPSAIREAFANGNEVAGTDLYLWGHWWCCVDCWNAMIKAGIQNVYLMEGSKEKWDR